MLSKAIVVQKGGGYDKVTTSIHDVAAPKLIIEEAGGTFTDWQGQATIEAGDNLAAASLMKQHLSGARLKKATSASWRSVAGSGAPVLAPDPGG